MLQERPDVDTNYNQGVMIMENKNIVAGIGACVADMLYTVETFPAEDSKLRAVDSKLAGGGPVATGLAAAARLGSRTAYLGNLSTDASGKFLLEDFKKYGVDTRGIRILQGEYRSFSSCIWLNQKNATRTCVFDKGNLPAYEPDETAEEILKQAGILMVDGNEMSAALKAADRIHEYGGKVLYDAGGLYPDVEKLLDKADILIPSAEFALGFTKTKSLKEAAEELFLRFHPEVVVITNGKEGGILYEGREILEYPAFPVKAVDSNGAGDVFHGAFAAGIMSGYSYRQCCIFSSMVSAIKCTGFGARQSVPSGARVLKALKEQGYEEFELSVGH